MKTVRVSAQDPVGPGGWLADMGSTAVAIGKFDGMHLGHQTVIERMTTTAATRGLAPVALTFDRNPLAVLDPERCPAPILELPDRLELLAAAGVAATVVLTFDRPLAATPPDVFAHRMLSGGLAARAVIVGAAFRFGARGAGDVAMLTAFGADDGFTVEAVPELEIDGERVSSTRIRNECDRGNVTAANAVLGRMVSVRGTVVPGAARGRKLGFPTANLSPALTGYLPADGIYAGWLRDGEACYPAAISVGNNPTFAGVPQRQVEAHVLDRALDLYGHDVTLAFQQRLRPMLAFAGLDELVAQIEADVRDARAVLR